MPAIDTIKLRRGTAAAWTSANPVLAAGEPGYETDTGNAKFGDGTTAWASLPYRVQPAAYASLSADNNLTGLQTLNLASRAAGGTAGLFIENQGNNRYGIAIVPGGSNYLGLYINYQNALDTGQAIGIDVGGGAVGGLLIACHTAVPAIQISGSATNLVEIKDGGGVTRMTVDTSNGLISAASNMGMRFYSDNFGTSVAEIKVDSTDEGLANFFNRGIRTKHWGATNPSGGYSGEIQLANGKIWVNDAGTWKSVAVA